jgi:Fe-S-cluster containining protein
MSDAPAPRKRLTQDDCVTCGACCCNPNENRRTGYVDYVQVTDRDVPLRRNLEALRTWAVRNEDGEWHLRLKDEEQRCAALQGELGVQVGCTIYALRPRACRHVQAGDPYCLRARRERGIDPE